MMSHNPLDGRLDWPVPGRQVEVNAPLRAFGHWPSASPDAPGMQRYRIKVGQERCLGPAQRARTQQAMDVAVMHGPTDEAGMELRLAVTNFRLHHKRRGSVAHLGPVDRQA